MARLFPYQKKLVIKRRKRVLLICLSSLIGLGIVSSGLAWLSYSEFTAIQNFSISGVDDQKTLDVNSMITNEISGKYPFFFSKKNIFLYPKNNIKQKILALPFVQNVEINEKGLNEVVVLIEEREESARWCEDVTLESSKCFSVDENGYIFGEIATSTAFIYHGLISDIPIGQQILSPDEFKKVQFFVRELGRMGISPSKARFGESGYITISLLYGGKLIVNTNDNLSHILSNISSILADKTVVPSVSGFLEKLDYIKLDSGNKVVYKLK